MSPAIREPRPNATRAEPGRPAPRRDEDRHLERQFAQGAPAASARLAGRPPARHRLPAGNQARGRDFPVAEIAAAGYQAAFSGQKTYNGVAILARATRRRLHRHPAFADEQKRLIAATVDGVRVVCAYLPNGQAVGSDKYEYKLRWLAALTGWLRTN